MSGLELFSLAGRRALVWVLAVLVHGVCNLAAVLLVSSGLPGAALIAEAALFALVAAFWVLFVIPSRRRWPSPPGRVPPAGSR